MEPSSAQLLSRFRGGDSQAAAQVYDRYVERLIALVRRRIGPRLAVRVDPDDIVQSAYRSFFLRAREGRFTIRECGDLWRLLAGIAKHKALSQVERHSAAKRDMAREAPSAAMALQHAADAEPSPAEAVALQEEVQAIMAPLTTRQRQTLELRLQDCTIADIARQLNRSERTIRRWLKEIQQQITARMDPDA